jgi:peptide/nickel transport system ATP-binding protein
VTPPDKTILAVDRLSVHIQGGAGTVRAVDRASLTVERGETLALVGESGSGKSMLCRAIMGLLPGRAVVAAGSSVHFLGRELTRLHPKEVSRIRGKGIGIVLQNPMSSLNPVLTIGRQIMEPILFHLGVSKPEAKSRAMELLDSVGIPRVRDIVACYPHQLSGGMRQRVAIAIALSCDPALLIADEPTTALDVTVQAGILDLLGRLQQEREMAMILVSHDLAVVAGRAHRTAVMYAGRIVEEAPTAELFDRPRMWYTRGLLDSIPRLDDPPGTELPTIEGRPPDPVSEVRGCPFAPRCTTTEPRCEMEAPGLVEDDADGGHRYACWFPCREDPCSDESSASSVAAGL